MKKNTKTEAVEHSLNPTDLKKRGILHELFTNAPIPNEELFSNIGLFIDRRNISRILWINELYSQITELHGNIIEFGTRFGANLSLFTSFRGIYEPYNYNRKIIAFDTFEGFPELDKKDKNSEKFWDVSAAARCKGGKYMWQGSSPDAVRCRQLAESPQGRTMISSYNCP